MTFRRIERRTIQTKGRTVLVEIIRKPGAKRGPDWKDLIIEAAKEAA